MKRVDLSSLHFRFLLLVILASIPAIILTYITQIKKLEEQAGKKNGDL